MEDNMNEKFRAFVDAEEEILNELHQKYNDLVWYARSNPDNWNRPKVWENVQRVQNAYPDEVKKLDSEENGDWTHGFNTGMLACLRLFDNPYGIQDGMKEFPFTDS